MSYADIRIVAIALIFASTYGIFLFLHESIDPNIYVTGSYMYENTTNLGFFDTLTSIGQLNVANPEIFFLNTIVFGVIAALLVFVGMRFVRGTG